MLQRYAGDVIVKYGIFTCYTGTSVKFFIHDYVCFFRESDTEKCSTTFRLFSWENCFSLRIATNLDEIRELENYNLTFGCI